MEDVIIAVEIAITGKDELDKVVCSQHVGLHSSVGRALQR